MLGVNDEPRLGEEAGQHIDVEEPEPCSIHAEHDTIRVAGRLGNSNHVIVNGLDLISDPDRPDRRVNDIDRVVGIPLLPLAQLGVPRLEDKPPTINQCAASEARRPSSVTRNWKAWLIITARSKSPSHLIEAAVPSIHSISGCRRATLSAARSGSIPTRRPV